MPLDQWAALVLAAGGSRRFGRQKLLADLAGQPVIMRTVGAVSEVGFGRVAVVTGAAYDAVQAALAGLSADIIYAADWHQGMASSIKAGVSALGPMRNGFFLFLGDMPLVNAALCKELADKAVASGYAARPMVGEVPGHPVCFTAAASVDLLGLSGDDGAGALLRRNKSRVSYLLTNDLGAVADVDRPADLALVEREWKARFTSATMESATSRGDLPNP